MNARFVHAVLAAGIENPSLLASWSADPGPLRAQGLAPGSVDLVALGRFAGLTVKVRHNPLREDWPLSFRLMSIAGLEIEIFTAYASFRSSIAGGFAGTTRQRARDLHDFLGQWLDGERLDHGLLWDLVRHEETVASMSAAGDFPAPARRRASTLSRPRSVPFVRGCITLHEMRCDPREAGAVLRLPTPVLHDVIRSHRRFCYWAPEPGDLRMVEVDAFGHAVLSLIDGRRSVAQIAKAMGAPQASRSFLVLVQQLSDEGLVGFMGTRR